MTNREACEVYIEQEIETGLEKGKTPYSIGKELSDWVAKLFEVRIKPTTLEKRAERHREKLPTNVGKESQPTEKIEDTTPEIIKDRHPQGGGKREGAGRKPIMVTEAMDFATMAITHIKSIRKDDPERVEALIYIKKYIEKELKEAQNG